MPFLFVLPKQPGPDLIPARLASRLCPYRGEVRRVALPHGHVYLSSLAGESAAGVDIPRGTRHGAQTSWLALTAGAHGVRFETDPLGTFPLWLAEDEHRLVVTGEVKSLVALDGFDVGFAPERWPAARKRPPDYSPYAHVRRIYPGAILHVAPDGSWREERRSPLAYEPPTSLTDPVEQHDRLETALLASARAIAAAGDRWAAFLSGGIDSSMTTALVGRHHPALAAYTLGTEHGDEYADAAALAGHLGLGHTRVFATREAALAHFERATFCNETVDGLTAETLAQLSLLAEAAAPHARRVVTGYGADLLFGSMLRHRLYLQVTGVDDLQSLIERTCWSGEFAPFYAWSFDLEVHHLFWDPAVMNVAFAIPTAASYDGEVEKVLLRALAVERDHLRREYAYRRKQALTDGTQFNRVLSAALGLADRHGYDDKSARAVTVLRRTFGERAG